MSEQKPKLKFAFYWAASCGGCEVAVVDVNEAILDVVAIADIVFWPVAIDIKYKDVEAMPDKSIDVCFFNGAVRNSEQEYLANLLRKKAKVMVAFGSCAHMGGVPGLANVSNKKEIFDTVYLHNPSTKNPEGVVPQPHCKVPEGSMEIPEFYDTVMALNQVVDVDYYLPGCPPTPKRIFEAVGAIASGKLPPKGTVLGPLKSVCDECQRKKEDKKISKIYRVYEKTPEPENACLNRESSAWVLQPAVAVTLSASMLTCRALVAVDHVQGRLSKARPWLVLWLQFWALPKRKRRTLIQPS
jgi:F420-non-reducing hydrogenase small subunit